MTARTVTRLCQAIFGDRVASWTNYAGSINTEGSLSKRLRQRIAAIAPLRYPTFYDVSPFRASLTPEEWAFVFDLSETCTADSAAITIVSVRSDGSSIYEDVSK